MTTFRALVAAILVLVTSGSARSADAVIVSDEKRIVASLFEAFNRHDADAIQRLYHPRATLRSSDFCAPRSHADVKRTYAALFAQHPAMHDEVQAVVAESGRVAVRFLAKLTPDADGGLEIASFLLIRDGLIVEDISIFDTGGQPCTP